jgi:hypothetical protein
MVRALCTLAVLSHLLACASQTRLPEPIRASVAAKHAGRTVELRQSCYYGDLYDENEKWLLSARPFSETYHIVDFDGEPIHPRGQRGIAPAGSRFTIRQVEFPDQYAVSMRMLTTPRYNPWVYLSPVEGSPLPTDRKAFIMLLPMDMETVEQVEAAIEEVLAPQGEVTAWLAERTPSIQVAIKHKDVALGMVEQELVAAMGQPHRWFNDTRDDQQARVAWYPTREAWLVGGKVVDITDARAIEKKPTATPPAETPPESPPVDVPADAPVPPAIPPPADAPVPPAIPPPADTPPSSDAD